MSLLISASSVLNRAYAGNVFFKDENYRKNGIMSGLLSYACKIAKERNADFLFLKPANEKLFSYYRKNGFEDAFYRAERLEYNDKEKYNYKYSRANFVQQCKRYVEEYIPQNGKKRGIINK